MLVVLTAYLEVFEVFTIRLSLWDKDRA